MADSNDTTEDYFDFVGGTLGEIYDTQAMLAGAQSLLFQSCDVNENLGLVRTNNLLSQINEKLEAIALRIDDSTLDYKAVSSTPLAA